MTGMQSASRVGALVVVFLVLAVGTLGVLQKGIWAKRTATYWAKFEDAGGLNRGAQVLLAGVNVGLVKAVELSPQGEALVAMDIDSEVVLPNGTTAVLPGSFIAIGDKVLTLQAPKGASGKLAANNKAAPIPGKQAGALDAILPDSAKTAEELNKTLVAFRELLEDPELRTNVNGLMKNAGTTAAAFGGTAQRVNGLIDENSGEINAVMVSVKNSLRNLEAVSAKVRQLATDGKFEGDVSALMKNLDAAVVAGTAMVNDLRAYTNDPEMKASLKATMTNVQSMTESGTKIAKDFESVSTNAIEISKQGAEAGVKVNTLLEKANKLADQVEKVVDDAKGALDKFGKGDKASLFPKIGFEADMMRESDPDRLRTDATVIIPVGKDKFHLGVYDAFESNKLTAQLQKRMGEDLSLRYGVYASKPGLGVDYATASRLGLRADLFGLNSTRLDLRARYDFGGGIRMWLGVDRVFDRNTPSIGIGIQRND